MLKITYINHSIYICNAFIVYLPEYMNAHYAFHILVDFPVRYYVFIPQNKILYETKFCPKTMLAC